MRSTPCTITPIQFIMLFTLSFSPCWFHYSDVIMSAMTSQITDVSIVCPNSSSLAFVRPIQRSPVNFPHKGPVTRQMFLFHDVIMICDRFLPVPRRCFTGLVPWQSCPWGTLLKINQIGRCLTATKSSMMTLSNGNIFRVTGPFLPVADEFPAQRPATWSSDVLFDLRLNKRLRLVIWDVIAPIVTSL